MDIDIKKTIDHLKTPDPITPQLQVMQRQPQVHDLHIRTWGSSYEILAIFDGGQRLNLVVWTKKDIQEGDYLILANGKDTTRYQIEEIKYMSDPPDQRFIKAIFAPREAPAE